MNMIIEGKCNLPNMVFDCMEIELPSKKTIDLTWKDYHCYFTVDGSFLMTLVNVITDIPAEELQKSRISDIRVYYDYIILNKKLTLSKVIFVDDNDEEYEITNKKQLNTFSM